MRINLKLQNIGLFEAALATEKPRIHKYSDIEI